MHLLFRGTDGTTMEFELGAVTRIGRGEQNGIRLFDESAEEEHCEVRMADGQVTVHDLGSTAGVLVDGEVVRDAVLNAGSTLRVGATEFTVEGATAERMGGPGAPGIEVCRNHAGVVADWRCGKCNAGYCSKCVVSGHKYGTPRVSYCPVCASPVTDLRPGREARVLEERSGHPLDAWKYPFRGEGLVLLVGGTLFLVMASVLQRFLLFLSVMVFIFVAGYLAAYSQKIIQSTAQREFLPPTWPDFGDFVQDILVPFVRAIGVALVYYVPFLVAGGFVPEGTGGAEWMVPGLLVLGVFFVPMAWLAVAMHDSTAALSPHIVIPAVLKVPGRYVWLVAQLGLLAGAIFGLNWALDGLRIPIVTPVVGTFVSLYMLMVASRMVGVFYTANEGRLWRL